MRRMTVAAVLLLGITLNSSGQDLDMEEMDISLDEQGPAVFDARFSIGFNYDLLRSPLEVSFEYPKGYFGLNIPFQQTINIMDIMSMTGGGMDEIFGDSSIYFRDPEAMQPVASARQSPNTTFRVDVPMVGGVGSFSSIETFNLSYLNTLGFPGARFGLPAMEGIDLLMRGAVYVPLEVAASWQTLTFGYAYKVNDKLSLALNLHRHVFTLDMRANIDVDLLGRADIDQDVVQARIPINYSVGGYARAQYDAEAWAPTIAIKYWRLGLTSRFGVNTQAHGEFKAFYELPFFVDPYTFEVAMDPSNFMDPSFISKLEAGATDSVVHVTQQDMTWKLPHGFTFSFDIVPNKLDFSYTKTVGNLEIGLGSIWSTQQTIVSEIDSSETVEMDTVDLDFKVTVDHVFLLNGRLKHFFFSLGIFTLDFHSGEYENILGKALGDVGYVTLGDSPIFPVLSLGSTLGSRMQLMLELDVLPLLALKTGVVYYF